MPSGPLFYVRAIAAFSGSEGQLTFKLGDVMGVSEENGGWYTAVLAGTSGLVPCNHVEVCFVFTLCLFIFWKGKPDRGYRLII